MRTIGYILPAALLTACGTMQETVQVRDDVYDIPDRTVVASVAPVPEAPSQSGSDDYYNADEASRYQQGSYYDRTYNDPAWFNRDRFGFGYNYSPWGSTWGMSYGTGWGNNTWFNSPTGYYNPYWGNSWQSGYGYYSPWNGGMYDPWGWQTGYGNGFGCGNNWGWNSPYGWGNNWGWNNGFGYGGYCGSPYGGYGGNGWIGPGNDFNGSPIVVAHRPSMGGGGAVGGANVQTVPRSARGNSISLLRPPAVQRKARMENGDLFAPTSAPRERGRIDQPAQPARKERKQHKERPAIIRERESRPDPSPSFERGGGGTRGGGGGSTSPRPRR